MSFMSEPVLAIKTAAETFSRSRALPGRRPGADVLQDRGQGQRDIARCANASPAAIACSPTRAMPVVLTAREEIDVCCGRKNRRKRTARIATMIGAAIASAAMNCHPMSTIRIMQGSATPGLKPAQQLRLLAGKFFVAQNSLAVEFGKLFERGEDVAGRLSCNGTRLRRRGRGPCSALGRHDRQGSHIHQPVLAGESLRGNILICIWGKTWPPSPPREAALYKGRETLPPLVRLLDS
jgi:hypothetical protein